MGERRGVRQTKVLGLGVVLKNGGVVERVSEGVNITAVEDSEPRCCRTSRRGHATRKDDA